MIIIGSTSTCAHQHPSNRRGFIRVVSAAHRHQRNFCFSSVFPWNRRKSLFGNAVELRNFSVLRSENVALDLSFFCFLLVYRGGCARKDHSTQKQEGPPLAAGHLWPPRQEADIQPAVTWILCGRWTYICSYTSIYMLEAACVMFELFLCNKIDLRSFHFEVFCLKRWPLTLILSDQYIHSSSVLHWLYVWATWAKRTRDLNVPVAVQLSLVFPPHLFLPLLLWKKIHLQCSCWWLAR